MGRGASAIHDARIFKRSRNFFSKKSKIFVQPHGRDVYMGNGSASYLRSRPPAAFSRRGLWKRFYSDSAVYSRSLDAGRDDRRVCLWHPVDFAFASAAEIRKMASFHPDDCAMGSAAGHLYHFWGDSSD